MSTLKNMLKTHRESFVADLSTLIEDSIQQSSGLSSLALKAAVKAGKKVNESIVSRTVNLLAPFILSALQPYWDLYQKSTTADFGTYLNAEAENVISDILSTTDTWVQRFGKSPLNRYYRHYRSHLAHMISPRLPLLGDIIEKYMRP
ncbi:hypothetical protein N7326_07700 [Corynebacterium sp. ES2794-CONJ1]|uniref:DUF6918 family protein n=1 Tax=unclassified Corynebacterium TaxID=2624378 RepID=UPI00216A8981|nr:MULTISPECIES: hypothetical protein [unclassified Corynebacterium]MCS4492227.1 hypothetical protein [Corynebacterium sp. ES2715-CONJ3]MCS4532289.1 hypothetical protein [Corynebacterium sp. ES2730-CONJ]MCU9519746.1 hypothetical protein [Corynebacterium sp. ES2794-CONJ1]